MNRFVDRERELGVLRERLARQSSLTLVWGQRRVGKTFLLRRLLEEERDVVYFLADETTAAVSRERFRAEVAAQGMGGPAWDSLEAGDWGAMLAVLLQACQVEGRGLVLVLDELQYLLAAEPALPSILQRLWDTFRDRLRLHVVLCGSALGVMGRLGDVGQPLHGRFDLRLKVQPFGFRKAGEFASQWPLVDRLRLYGVFGGLPRHLAEVDPERSLGDNATAALLDPFGSLHEAASDQLRAERLSSRAEANAVLAAVAAGEGAFGAIAARCGITAPRLDYVLRELLSLELVRREVRFGDREGSRYVRWRPTDPFLTFWFRHVLPNRGALQGSSAERIWAERVAPRLDDHMGPVFEEVVRQAVVGGCLGAEVGPVDEAASWWSRDGETQVDLVARAGDRRVFVEAKWAGSSRADVGALRQLEDHLRRYPRPHEVSRGLLCVASAGGFTDRLEQAAEAQGVFLLGPGRLTG